MEIYLDNSATTKPHGQVVSAMVSSMNHGYFNPSALYAKGFEVEKSLAAVRQEIAQRIQGDPKEVLFTSGGTEANNLAILGYLQTLRLKGTILYSQIEHPAVIQSCKKAQEWGFTAKEIPVNKKGVISLDALKGLLDDQVVLICLMQVNNEVGSIQPIEKAAALRDQYSPQAALHVDGVQGFLRVPLYLKKWNIQSYAISGHKIHGPKGVGALIKQSNHRLAPMMYGGGQERELRSGTENTPGIIGLGKAIEVFSKENIEALKERKNLFWHEVKNQIPPALRLGPQAMDEEDSPHILNVALPPLRAETLLHALEGQGVYVSTGSACSSKKQKIASTLVAMGVGRDVGQSAIRISLSPYNTWEELEEAARMIQKHYSLLAPYQKR